MRTENRSQLVPQRCSCRVSRLRKFWARWTSFTADSHTEALAWSWLVATAATFSSTSGTPSSTWRRMSWPTTRSEPSTGRRMGSWWPTGATWRVRVAMATWMPDWLVAVSSRTVSPSISRAWTGSRCWLARVRSSETLRLATRPSIFERTVRSPDQFSATTVSSIAARCRLASEVNCRVWTVVRRPCSSSKVMVRESTPRRRSISWPYSTRFSSPGSSGRPWRGVTTSGVQSWMLTMCSVSTTRPWTIEVSRLNTPAM